MITAPAIMPEELIEGHISLSFSEGHLLVYQQTISS